MDKHQADAELLGSCVRPQHRILEQRAAQALSLVALINRQASQQDGWYRPLLRLSFARSFTRLSRLKLGSGQGVVANDSIAISRDEDSGRTRRLGPERVIGEPAIKLRLPTGKGPTVMLALERLRARVGH